MTIDEAILYMTLYCQKLVGSVSDLDKDIEAYDMAIKALKQYGALQEIRQEILDLKQGYMGSNCVKDDWLDCKSDALEIIDKHIKEIERSDAE